MNILIHKFLTLEGQMFMDFIWSPEFATISEALIRSLTPKHSQVEFEGFYDIWYILNTTLRSCQITLRRKAETQNWDITTTEKLRNYICKAARNARNKSLNRLMRLIEQEPTLNDYYCIQYWPSFMNTLYSDKEPAVSYIRTLLIQNVDTETSKFLKNKNRQPTIKIREAVISGLNSIINQPEKLFCEGKFPDFLKSYINNLPKKFRKVIMGGNFRAKAARYSARHLLDHIFSPYIKPFQQWQKSTFLSLDDKSVFINIPRSNLSDCESHVIGKMSRDYFMKCIREILHFISEKYPRRSEIINLSLFSDMKQKDIAKLTGTTYSSLRKTLSEVRGIMRVMLMERGITADFFSN